MVIRDNHKLITSGPYSIVRHPGYTAFVVLLSGNILLLASKGSYFTEAGLWNSVVGKTIAYSILGYLTWVGASLCWRTPEEDAMMRRAFGPEWDEWARRTRYCLFPFVY